MKQKTKTTEREKMKTQKTTLVLSVIMSFILLLITSACGDKSDSAEERGQQLQEKELIESGKQGVEDLAGKINLLTIADIEKVTGLPGVKLVPRNPKIGAGGDLNFATADDNLLVMLVVADMDIFNQWKTGKNYVYKQLTNIGDEAYSAPGGGVQYIVFFKSGNEVASISSFLNLQTGDPLLTINQLSELAKIAVSRM
jgi:hypothetical protein